MSHARLRLLPLLLVVCSLAFAAPPTAASQATIPEETAPLIKRQQQRMLMQKARAKFVRMAVHAEELRTRMLAEEEKGLAPEEQFRLKKKAAPERVIRKKP